MPFTFPDDMTLECYEMYRNARPTPGHDPLRQGGELPAPGGHDHDEDDSLKIDSLWAVGSQATHRQHVKAAAAAAL